MGLRFDPVGGGQFKEALRQIIEAESQPLKQLEARKQREETKLKLFQEFKSRFMGVDKTLGELSNFKKFRELKVDLGDGQNVMSVTVDKEKAQPGSYEIEVSELARRTSVISNGFSSAKEPVLCMGFVVVRLSNGEKFELFVDNADSSLNGVAQLINNQKDAPVQAAVVKDEGNPDNPYRLILSAKKEGFENQVDFPEFYFLDGDRDFYFNDTRESRNALLTVDGFEVELEGNQISDFLPGVNAQLKQARPGQPFTLNITEDTAKVSGKVKAMVDEINKVLSFINDQNKLDEKSDTRSTFGGDTGLQAIEYRIRNMLHEGFPVGDPDDEDNFRLVFLNQIGIEFDKTGLISFKEEKFQKALESDFNAVSEGITREDFGFARQLREVLAGYTRAGSGMLALREQGFRSRIKQIDDQIDFRTRILERRQQSLTEQFSRLQGSLANLQRQQSYLQATMPTPGGGSLVSQLLGG